MKLIILAPIAPEIVEFTPNDTNLEAEMRDVVVLSCQVNETIPASEILWMNKRV